MKRLQWFARHQWLSLTGILAVFSAIAFGNMNRWSIWFDEGFSAYIIRFDYALIAHYTGLDVHPPLYYWLLKTWTLLFGASPVGMRSMSWFFAVVALVGLYLLIRRVFRSSSVALVAVGFASLTPLLIRYADEARMYTLSFAIITWATYALFRAMQTKNRRWWVLYAVLLMAGMLTHYLIALAWIVHWIWRWVALRGKGWRVFFSREWIGAHVVAVALYAWWTPLLIKQFTSVQQGFWIPAVTARTPIDYLSNALLYRYAGETTGWWAFVVVVLAASTIVSAIQAVRVQKKAVRSEALLLGALAFLPPLLLMLVSMPPLRSTFVDRYVLFSAVILMALAGVGVRRLMAKRPRLAVALGAVIILSAVTGIAQVYHDGNANKNSAELSLLQAGDVVKLVGEQGTAGQPIIAANAWLYYEAATYSTEAHPVMYLNESLTEDYGSLAMLKDDAHGKIMSLSDYTSTHRYVWYLKSADASVEIEPPVATWKKVKQVSAYDYLRGATRFRAVLYDTQAN